MNLDKAASIVFERCSALRLDTYWFCFWPQGELRTFRDEESARAFAARHCLDAIFAGEDKA
jgi:hypothetical protein